MARGWHQRFADVAAAVARMGDLDNGIKPLMDWLQRVELIEDDKYCDRILAQWGGPVPLKGRRAYGWVVSACGA